MNLQVTVNPAHERRTSDGRAGISRIGDACGVFGLDDVNVEDLFRRRACVMNLPGVEWSVKTSWFSRFDKFSRAEWLDLFEGGSRCAEEASTACRRRRRREVMWRRNVAAKALVLIQVGELSSARQSFEGADLAPVSDATLQELRNPVREPILEIYAIWCHQSSNWMKSSSCERCGHPNAVQQGDSQA